MYWDGSNNYSCHPNIMQDSTNVRAIFMSKINGFSAPRSEEPLYGSLTP